jgi:peptidyl-prolyl cis-trans isomerase SurA
MKKFAAFLFVAAVTAAPRLVAAQATMATARSTPVDRVVAVVGTDPIMESEVIQAVIQRQQQDSAFHPPAAADTAGWAQLQSAIINSLIDERLLLQKAKDEGLDIPDSLLAPSVDRQIAGIRAQFSEAQYRAELAKAGLGTPEEYRQFLMEQMRNNELQQEVTAKLKRDGKILPVPVSEDEVQKAFEGIKGNLPRRPATFTWHQIVINPEPSAKEKAVAKARIDSIRAEIVAGGDFARIAKRESADSTTREVGGDLGWNRRGSGLVPSFEQWLFAMEPGKVSPVFETPFGYHILRVDRVNGPERKARHILIQPTIDSADIARTQALADSVKQMWINGVPFDTLARKYHDYASREETSVLTPYPFDSLPQTYQDAFAGLHAGDAVVFKIANTQHPGTPKFVVARVESYQPGGQSTLADVRNQLRGNLEQSAAIRRYLDDLRKKTFVEIKPDALAPPPRPTAGAGP